MRSFFYGFSFRHANTTITFVHGSSILPAKRLEQDIRIILVAFMCYLEDSFPPVMVCTINYNAEWNVLGQAFNASCDREGRRECLILKLILGPAQICMAVRDASDMTTRTVIPGGGRQAHGRHELHKQRTKYNIQLPCLPQLSSDEPSVVHTAIPSLRCTMKEGNWARAE